MTDYSGKIYSILQIILNLKLCQVRNAKKVHFAQKNKHEAICQNKIKDLTPGRQELIAARACMCACERERELNISKCIVLKAPI